MLKSVNNPFAKRIFLPSGHLENMLIICGIKHNNFLRVNDVENYLLTTKKFVDKFCKNSKDFLGLFRGGAPFINKRLASKVGLL